MSPMPEIQNKKLKHLRFGIMGLRGFRERLRRSCLKVIKIKTVHTYLGSVIWAQLLIRLC
jgi:hypothetical protein